MPAVSAGSSGVHLLHEVVDFLGPGATYKQAKQILEHAINQLPAGRSKQALLDGLPKLRRQLKKLLHEATPQQQSRTCASHSGFLSAVHEASHASNLLVQTRLPAHKQLLHSITAADGCVHDHICACSRLCGASAQADVSYVVHHACELADTALKPAAESLLVRSCSGNLQVRPDATPSTAKISNLVDTINELGAIARLRATSHSKEPVELLHNVADSIPGAVWGRLLFTLATAQVCKSLLNANGKGWNHCTFMEVHGEAVSAIQQHCLLLHADDIERFLLWHPVMNIDSLEAAPWAAVPMCAWLAVRAAVRSPPRNPQPLQAVLLQRAELQLQGIVGDMSFCARETALVRDKPCTSEAVAWVNSLPAETGVLLCSRNNCVTDCSLAAVILEHANWADIQTLSRLYISSATSGAGGSEEKEQDETLFVLDTRADASVQPWELTASQELSDQGSESSDGDE